jgi:hypothetical protein
MWAVDFNTKLRKILTWYNLALRLLTCRSNKKLNSLFCESTWLCSIILGQPLLPLKPWKKNCLQQILAVKCFAANCQLALSKRGYANFAIPQCTKFSRCLEIHRTMARMMAKGKTQRMHKWKLCISACILSIKSGKIKINYPFNYINVYK